jgi:hypothetical protein
MTVPVCLRREACLERDAAGEGGAHQVVLEQHAVFAHADDADTAVLAGAERQSCQEFSHEQRETERDSSAHRRSAWYARGTFR